MPRIRCRYVDCMYLESGFCSTDQIDLDPELGCLTYTQEEEDLGIDKEEEWEEGKVLGEEEEEEEWDEEEIEDEELDDEDLDEDEEDW